MLKRILGQVCHVYVTLFLIETALYYVFCKTKMLNHTTPLIKLLQTE